jgi:hypothetical protein
MGLYSFVLLQQSSRAGGTTALNSTALNSTAVAWGLRCALAALTGAPVGTVRVDSVYDAAARATRGVAPAANDAAAVCAGGARALQAGATPSRLPSFTPLGDAGFRAELGVRFAVDPSDATDGAAQLAAAGKRYADAAAAGTQAGVSASGPFAGYFSALAEVTGEPVEDLVRGVAFRTALVVPSPNRGAAAGVSAAAAAPLLGTGSYVGIALGAAAAAAALAAAALRSCRAAAAATAKAPAPQLLLSSANPLQGAGAPGGGSGGGGGGSPFLSAANPLLATAARLRLAQASAGWAAGWGEPGDDAEAAGGGGGAHPLPRPALALAAYFQPGAAGPLPARAARAVGEGHRSPLAASPPGPLALGRGRGGTVLDRAGLSRRVASPLAAAAASAGEEPLPGSAAAPQEPGAAPVLQRAGLAWKGAADGATVTQFNPVLPARGPGSPAGGASPVRGGLSLRSA